MYEKTESGVAKRETEISSLMNTLQKEITSFREEVETLCSRINPILRGDEPQLETSDKPLGYSSPLAQTLNDEIQRIVKLRRELINMTDRVEL